MKPEEKITFASSGTLAHYSVGKTVGTCSLCEGPVETIYFPTKPNSEVYGPKCSSCGAVPKTPHGPVILMQLPEKLS